MKFENSLTRILVAIIFIPVLLAASYFGEIYFLIFNLLIGTAGFFELKRMLLKKNIFIGNLPLAASLLLILNAYYKFNNVSNIFLMSLVLILIFELFNNRESAIHNLGGNFLAVFYPGFLLSIIIYLRDLFGTGYQGGLLIITIFISIWMCDSGAYFIGSAIGKHKLFPRVSPKKSWEGAAAGLIFGILGTVLSKIIIVDFLTWSDAIVIGSIVGTFGQIGDLIESLLKRDAQIKDSSNIIPGHGGILDRFDSFFISAPLIYFYFRNFY